MSKKRRYTAEFKREAVELVTKQGYAVTQAAKNLGINTNMLGRWKRELQNNEADAFPGHGRQSAEHDEIARLRKENRELRMERDILKKATAFFAKETS